MGAIQASEMPWVIFDIDGTLADVTHRLEVLPDYDKFNSLCGGDTLKQDIMELYTMCFNAGYNICIMTGREAKWSAQTTAWLNKNGIATDFLLMRPTGSCDSDHEVKKMLFERHMTGKRVLFVVDDRQSVVDMWRKIGLTCLQCQKGDY